MNEHRTASFVAGMAWAVFLGMLVALFAGYDPGTAMAAWGTILTGLIAAIASIICAPPGTKK